MSNFYRIFLLGIHSQKIRFWLDLWVTFFLVRHASSVTFTYLFVEVISFQSIPMPNKYLVCFNLFTQISVHLLCNPTISLKIQFSPILLCSYKNSYRKCNSKTLTYIIYDNSELFTFLWRQTQRHSCLCNNIIYNYNERYMIHHNPYRKQRIFND